MDRHGIAERLRCLIGGGDRDRVAEVAVRLGVPELSLRMSIDDVSPHPTIEVLAAVVRVYGVDPTWLLQGDYSSASHREAAMFEEAGRRDAVVRMLQRLINLGPPSHARTSLPTPMNELRQFEN